MEIVAFALIPSLIAALVFPNFKKIINHLAGKKIAVLGASTAGKTTLFRYLEMLPMESTDIRATRTISETGIGQIQIRLGNKTVDFLCKATKDMPGDIEHRNMYWEKLVKESDIVLYIVNAYKLLRGEDKEETQKRVKEDLEFIRKVQNFEAKKVIVIGNHFDEIDQNFAYSDETGIYMAEFRNNEVIKEQGVGMDTIVASFKEDKGFGEAMKKVYKIIKAKS